MKGTFPSIFSFFLEILSTRMYPSILATRRKPTGGCTDETIRMSASEVSMSIFVSLCRLISLTVAQISSATAIFHTYDDHEVTVFYSDI